MSIHTIPAAQLQPGDVIDASLPTIVGYTHTVATVEPVIFDGEPWIRYISFDSINPARPWKSLAPATRLVTITRPVTA